MLGMGRDRRCAWRLVPRQYARPLLIRMHNQYAPRAFGLVGHRNAPRVLLEQINVAQVAAQHRLSTARQHRHIRGGETSFVTSRYAPTCWLGNRGVDDEAVAGRVSADQVCRSSLRCMQGRQQRVLELAHSERVAVGWANNDRATYHAVVATAGIFGTGAADPPSGKGWRRQGWRPAVSAQPFRWSPCPATPGLRESVPDPAPSRSG
jgi:hypothetical protein